MGIVVVPKRDRLKRRINQKEIKKNRKPKGKSTARKTGNKEGKMASATNKDIAGYRHDRQLKEFLALKKPPYEVKSGKAAANKALARINRARGQAARKAQKRSRKQQ